MSIKKVVDSVNKNLKNIQGKRSKKAITVWIAAVAGVSAVIGFVLYLRKKPNSETMDKIKDCTNSVKRTFNKVVDKVKYCIDKEKQEIIETEDDVVYYEQDIEDAFSEEDQAVKDETIKDETEKTVDDISGK